MPRKKRDPDAPKQTSEKQKLANQRNSQLSTGPKTEAGKAVSKMNAVKHGGYARSTLLATESEEIYMARRQEFHDDLRPRDRLEEELVDDIVASSWRVVRVRNSDTAILSQKVLDATRAHDLAAEDQFDEWRRTLAADPKHVSALLRGTVRGCLWAADLLESYLSTLDVRGFWYPSERDKMLHVLGLRTEDLFINGLAWDIIRPFLEAGWGDETNGDLCRVQALIRSPAPAGMSTWEYRHRVDTLAKLTVGADPAAARAQLNAVLRPEIESLRHRAKILQPREDYNRATARDRAGIDISPEGQTRLRCESIHRRDFRHAVRDFMSYRKSNNDKELKESQEIRKAPPPGVFEARNEARRPLPPLVPMEPPTSIKGYRGEKAGSRPSLIGPGTHAKIAFGEDPGPDWDLLDDDNPIPENIRLFADQVEQGMYDWDMEKDAPM